MKTRSWGSSPCINQDTLDRDRALDTETRFVHGGPLAHRSALWRLRRPDLADRCADGARAVSVPPSELQPQFLNPNLQQARGSLM